MDLDAALLGLDDFSCDGLGCESPIPVILGPMGNSDISSSKDSESNSENSPAESNQKRRRHNANNPLGNLGGIYVNKRSNGRKVTHMVLPRILKTDSRRNYAVMFSNAFNSCDMGLMQEFASTFGSPQAVFSHHFADSLSVRGHKAMVLCGPIIICDTWAQLLRSTPDLIFHLGDTRLTARSDGTARVDFEFRLTGSSLVPERALLQALTESRVCGPDQQASGVLFGLQEQVEMFHCGGRLVVVPFEVRGMATMHLDDQSHIQELQLTVTRS